LRILALDPGVTTGVALYCDDKWMRTQWAFEGTRTPHANFYTALNALHPDLIIYEPFHFRQNKTGTDFTGVEYIGIIRMFGQQKEIPTKTITPGQGKGFWTNDKIKSLALWVPGKLHAMDATRILMTYLSKNDIEWFSAALAKLKEHLNGS